MDDLYSFVATNRMDIEIWVEVLALLVYVGFAQRISIPVDLSPPQLLDIHRLVLLDLSYGNLNNVLMDWLQLKLVVCAERKKNRPRLGGAAKTTLSTHTDKWILSIIG